MVNSPLTTYGINVELKKLLLVLLIEFCKIQNPVIQTFLSWIPELMMGIAENVPLSNVCS